MPSMRDIADAPFHEAIKIVRSLPRERWKEVRAINEWSLKDALNTLATDSEDFEQIYFNNFLASLNYEKEDMPGLDRPEDEKRGVFHKRVDDAMRIREVLNRIER
ncbi:hypothetical protein [uncultured Sneathiella sp.]|uniref:hypothetical protein n=1 Tax=uncultured Sneathiella sp. TaxID=879315 RepID=UPI0030D92FA8